MRLSRHRIRRSVTDAPSAFELVEFEQVQAGARAVLLRLAARRSTWVTPEGLKLLIEGTTPPARLDPIPAPPSPADPVRVAFSVAAELAGPDARFAVELADGSTVPLPAPTRRQTARRQTPLPGDPPRPGPPEDPRLAETERRAASRRLAIVELQRRLSAEHARRMSAETEARTARAAATADAAAVVEARTRVAEIQAEAEHLTRELEDVTQAAALRAQAASELADRVAELEGAAATDAARLADARAEIERSEAAVADARREVEELERMLAEAVAEREAERLRQGEEIREMQQRAAGEAEAAHTTSDGLRAQITDLECRLEDEQVRLESAEAEADSAHERLAGIEAELVGVKHAAEEVASALADRTTELEHLREAMGTRDRELAREREQRNREHARELEERDRRHADELEQREREHAGVLQERDREHVTLLEARDRDHADALAEREREHERQLEQLRGEFERELARERAEAAVTHEALLRSAAEIELLRAHDAERAQATELAPDQVRELEQALEQAHAQAEAEAQAQDARIAALRAQLAVAGPLEGEALEVAGALAAAELALADARSAEAAAHEALSARTAEVELLVQAIRERELDAERHESELAAANGEIAVANAELAAARAQLETAASEYASLEEQLAGALAGAHGATNGDGENTERELMELRGALERAQNRARLHRQHSASLEEQLHDTNHELTSLQEKIAAAGGLGGSGASEDELESLREQVAYGEALAADLAWQLDELRTAGDVAENALALRAAEVELLTLALRELGESESTGGH